MIIRIKKKKLNILWPILIFKVFLPFLSTTIFGQSFLILISFFGCVNGFLFVNSNIPCKSGSMFAVLAPFIIIASILLVLIALITNVLYYKPLFNIYNSNILTKNGSLPDVVLLLTKIIINIMFIFDKNNDEDHWVMIFFLILFCGFNAYITIFYENKINNLIILLNKTLCLILFLSSLSLFLGKILKFTGFNGLIILFFVFVLIVIAYIIFYKKQNINFILIDYKNINKPDEYLKYVSNFYNIVTNKNNSRENNLFFKSLIFTMEGKCLDKDCPLKKYLLNEKKGLDSQYLLIKSGDKLFQYGIRKFPNDINLKVNYIMYLLFVINNSKKALLILNSIEDEKLSFINNYSIYLCRNLINKNNYEEKDQNNSFEEYKNEFHKFQELIKKNIFLYFQFISLLLENKHKNMNNFEKINEIGNQIIYFKKEIDDRFDIIKKFKTYNVEIITLYVDYIKIICDNKDKYQLLQYNDISNNEINYCNVNIQAFKEKDNIYSIISGNKNKLGKILDCSNNFSKIFGYQKNEIIGKNINILIPEIFHKKHNLLILKRANDDKLSFYEKLNNKKKFHPNYIDKEIYCITKSKFLLSLKIKIYPAETQEKDFVYISKIIQNNPLIDYPLNMKEENPKYCILTDNNLIIKNFTPNCLEHLNFQYKYIESDICLINNIKEFHEDYLIAINNTNISKSNNDLFFIDKSSDYSEKKRKASKNHDLTQSKIVKDIINKKYFKKCQITWIMNTNDLKNSNIDKKDNSKKSLLKRRVSSKNFFIQLKNIINEKEIVLNMEIKKIILDKELLGYYFLFTNIDFIKDNNCYKTKSNIFEEKKFNHNNTIKNNNVQIYNSQIINSKTHKINHNNDKIKRAITEKELKEEFKNSSSSFIQNVINKKDNFEKFVKENYISQSLYLSFNINDFSFELLKNKSNNKNFNESLKKEASFKIREYKEYLKSIQKSKIKSSSISTESEDEIESNSSSNIYSESSGSSSNNDNPSLKPKNKLKLKSLGSFCPIPSSIKLKKTNIINIDVINKCKTNILNHLNERRSISNENGHNHIKKILKNEKSKLPEKKELNNYYYKVNLNNIHFFIYDFNREMLIDNTKNKISKVDEIIKNKNIIYIGKDNTYPNFSHHKKKNNDENNIKEKKQKENLINTSINDSENKKKSFENKISDFINSKEEESSIKKLKILSIISFFIVLICGVINLYFNLVYYNTISILIKLLKNSVIMRYTFGLGIYYEKELTLLTFDVPMVVGGYYTTFPGYNRTAYQLLIMEKFYDLYLDNEEAIKFVLSSSFSFCKNYTEYLSNLTFTLYFRGNSKSYTLESNFDETIVQFNNALLSMVYDADILTQNHNDLFNFNRNNAYIETADILINLYDLELKSIIKTIRIYYFISLIIYFILFVMIFIFLFFSFLSANKKRINYMDIFYGINEDLLKKTLKYCQILINKLKTVNHHEINEEEEGSNYSLEKFSDKMNKDKNKYNNNLSFININNENLNKNKYFTNDIIYIILFGLFMLIIFIIFIINCVYIFNISNHSLLISQFYSKFQLFLVNYYDIFNTYRIYLYDETSHSSDGISILKILELSLVKTYDSVTADFDYIQNYIDKYIPKKEEIVEISKRNLCSYYFTDYFNSTEQCLDKYQNSLKYNFIIFITGFLQEIRVVKNLFTYLLGSGIVRGSLHRVTPSILRQDPLMPLKGSNVTGTIFRFDLYNNDTLHNNLNNQFINIIVPYFENLKNVIFKYLLIEGDDFYFIIIFISYLILLALLFFVYWWPIINHFSNIIYKTKNMLSIIPISMLAYQNNIEILTHLSNKK